MAQSFSSLRLLFGKDEFNMRTVRTLRREPVSEITSSHTAASTTITRINEITAGNEASSQERVFRVADSLQALLKHVMPLAVDIAGLHTFPRRIRPTLRKGIH